MGRVRVHHVAVDMLDGAQWSFGPSDLLVGSDGSVVALRDVADLLSDPNAWLDFPGECARQVDRDEGEEWLAESHTTWYASTVRIFGRAVAYVTTAWDTPSRQEA